MLVTDVGDEICWRQLWDVGDAFGRFRHQHPLSFNVSLGHQQPKNVTNIEILSLTFKNCHQNLCSRFVHYFSAVRLKTILQVKRSSRVNLEIFGNFAKSSMSKSSFAHYHGRMKLNSFMIKALSILKNRPDATKNDLRFQSSRNHAT